MRDMPYDKKKRAQPSKKRKIRKQAERSSSPRSDVRPVEPGEAGAMPELSRHQDRRPGEGLDRSDEGVIAGSRLKGQRFKG
jgi:hypothetical protein